LQDFSAIDIWSRKFIRQKLNYIHNNPVRAGLCDHPAKWRWSSYRAYLSHRPGEVPIEIDQRWLWSEEELCLADGGRTSPPCKQSSKQSEESSGGQVRPLNDQTSHRADISGGQVRPLNEKINEKINEHINQQRD